MFLLSVNQQINETIECYATKSDIELLNVSEVKIICTNWHPEL